MRRGDGTPDTVVDEDSFGGVPRLKESLRRVWFETWGGMLNGCWRLGWNASAMTIKVVRGK